METIFGQPIFDVSNHCVSNPTYLTLYPTFGSSVNILLIFWRFIFPVQFVIGFIGNCLNLIILLGKTYRSNTNTILACLAFCDLSYLLFLLPNSVATIEALALNNYFYVAYRLAYYHLVALANWFHAASTWIIMLVTMHRLTLIAKPLLARSIWTTRRLRASVAVIVITTFLLTFYDNFSNVVRFYSLCNGTQFVSKQRHIENIPTQWHIKQNQNMVSFVRITLKAKLVCVHLVPLFALLTLNTMLLFCLKRSHSSIKQSTNYARASLLKKSSKASEQYEQEEGEGKKESTNRETANGTVKKYSAARTQSQYNANEKKASVKLNYVRASLVQKSSRVSKRCGQQVAEGRKESKNSGTANVTVQKYSAASTQSQHDAKERKVTVMVFTIVTTFTVCNAPMMITTLLKLCTSMDRFYNLAVVANGLEVTGLVLNFFMYCMSSAHFRNKVVSTSSQCVTSITSLKP